MASFVVAAQTGENRCRAKPGNCELTVARTEDEQSCPPVYQICVDSWLLLNNLWKAFGYNCQLNMWKKSHSSNWSEWQNQLHARSKSYHHHDKANEWGNKGYKSRILGLYTASTSPIPLPHLPAAMATITTNMSVISDLHKLLNKSKMHLVKRFGRKNPLCSKINDKRSPHHPLISNLKICNMYTFNIHMWREKYMYLKTLM